MSGDVRSSAPVGGAISVGRVAWDTDEARIVSVSSSVYDSLLSEISETKADRVTHQGRCHCGALQFHVTLPDHFSALECNCSICSMRGYFHVLVSKDLVHLLPSESEYRAGVIEYRFNSMVARHTFCSKCGVQPVYSPRSGGPDIYSVNLRCVDPKLLPKLVPLTHNDGKAMTEVKHL
jgi:hypothetical protein